MQTYLPQFKANNSPHFKANNSDPSTFSCPLIWDCFVNFKLFWYRHSKFNFMSILQKDPNRSRLTFPVQSSLKKQVLIVSSVKSFPFPEKTGFGFWPGFSQTARKQVLTFFASVFLSFKRIKSYTCKKFQIAQMFKSFYSKVKFYMLQNVKSCCHL